MTLGFHTVAEVVIRRKAMAEDKRNLRMQLSSVAANTRENYRHHSPSEIVKYASEMKQKKFLNQSSLRESEFTDND